MRGATGWAEDVNGKHIQFQSTRPMRGATDAVELPGYTYPISIHAPHAGRDLSETAAWDTELLFQSTRPMRGATAKVYKITLHTFATKGNS